MDQSKKEIFKLIIPLMIEQFLAVSVGMVDTLMVSFVGQTAVSGVALVENINRLVILCLSAFATGGVVIVSQYYGNKDAKNAQHSCAQLITIMTLFSSIMAILLFFITTPIVHGIFGHVEAKVMDASICYLRITALSYPFLGLYNASAAIYRSIGNSKLSMKVSLLINILNTIFDAWFVIGLHMGVFGVALATVINRAFGGILMYCLTLSHSNPLRVYSISQYFPNYKKIIQILRIGIPSSVENGMYQIGKLIVVTLVSTLGTNAIAANAIGYQIIDIPNIPGMAIGLALVTITGQNIGAGNYAMVKKNIRRITSYAYIGDWCCKIVLFITAPWIVNLFSLSSDASSTTIMLLRMFSVASLPIWPLSYTLPNALRAAGDVKYTMIVSILSMWLFRIGSSYLFVRYLHLGVYGVWLGMFIDWYVRGACYLICYITGKWK